MVGEQCRWHSRTMRPILPAALAAAALTTAGLAVVATAPAATAATTLSAYALSGTNLLSFDPAAPATVTTKALTGVLNSETLVGIDVRPANGRLYTVGINSTADNGTLYSVDTSSGALTAVGAAGSIAFTSDGAVAVQLASPATATYGVDFNPQVDRLRLTAGTAGNSDLTNARVNPDTGAGVDGDIGMFGTQPDGDIKPANVDEVAYTDSRAGATVTTLYTLDSVSHTLRIQNPPNAGTQTAPKNITVGGAILPFSRVGGFDIDPTVSAPAANAAVTTGVGYAVLTALGTTGLYRIDLTTGAATLVGPVGSAATTFSGLALVSVTTPDPTPAAKPATITTTGKPRVKGSKVTLGRTVVCPAGGAPCPVSVTVRTRGKKSKSVTKPFSTTVAPGSSLALKVKLNNRGKKLLQSGKVKVTIAITSTTAAGAKPATTTAKAVLKKKATKGAGRRP